MLNFNPANRLIAVKTIKLRNYYFKTDESGYTQTKIIFKFL